MNLIVALAALQDSGELVGAIRKTSEQTAYSFTFQHPAGRGEQKAVRGVWKGRGRYLKCGGIEIVQGPRGVRVRLEGGDWVDLPTAHARLREAEKRGEPKRSPGLDELLGFPAPHVLVSHYPSWVPKPAKKDAAFEGDLASKAAQDLLKQDWVRLGAEVDLVSPGGTAAIEIDGSGRVKNLTVSIRGHVLPGSTGRRPPPRNPPSNARQARRYETPEIEVRTSVDLDYSQTELPVPEDVRKAVGLD